MPQRRYLLAATLFIAMVSRVVDASEPAVEPQSDPTAALEGQSWQLVGYRSADGLVEVIAKDRPMLFRFEDGRISGDTGCNQVSGSYTLDGSRLMIGKNMASTMMACPDSLMKQEQAVTAALVAVATYQQAGDRLELLDSTDQALLDFQVFKPSPLVGKTWVLEVYDQGNQGLASPITGTEVSLEFHEQGTLGGSDGCNRYMSGYQLEDDHLTIGPIATTRMACRGSADVAAQAAAYAAMLGTVTGYRVEGRQLTLINSKGKTVARFQTPAPPDQID